MISRSLGLGAVSGLLTVIMVIISPGVASASGSICATSCASQVDFQSYGEIFTVHDYAADGRATYGQILVYKNGGWQLKAEVWNRNGYNGPPVSVNLEIVEGRSVKYIACFGEGSGYGDCGYWHHDTA